MSTATDRRAGGEARGVTIRPAGVEDLGEASAVIERVGLFLGGIDAQFGPQYVLAVAPDGAIVGMAGVETYGSYGLLRSVAVLDSWRGRGIAAELSRDRIAWARTQSLDAVYLFTKHAAPYWARFGFVLVPLDTLPAALHAAEQWRSARERDLVSMVLTLPREGS